jgi:hypothetical protein
VTDFFISYTHADRKWAEWIAWQLEAAGYTTVNQAWDFRPGANFALAMQQAVAESARTIAVLSPAYLQSGFTAAEWAAAFTRDPTGTQGLLLPVRIHDCEPGGLLPQIVYIDLVGLDAEAARETLLAGVERQRAKPPSEPGFPGPSPRPITTPPLFPGALPPALNTYQTQITSGDDQFRRNRSQMLEKVRLIWIKGLLEPSLHQIARIELGLETKPDAVDHPFDLLVQRPEQEPQPLPTGTPISHIFDEVGKALLILGEPGAGKTTLLLELTRDLLDRAVQDERHLIPVVSNLSSWAEQRLALADWLIDELNKRYDVPRQLAKTWIDAGLIIPLLDGLDEVAVDHRGACVEAINAFLNEHGLLPMVVCSRVADYEALAVRLRLPSAVIIQSLSRQQVESYVDQAGASLAGLRTMLQADEALGELLNTPLMLSIGALAYQGRSADEIRSLGTGEEHRTKLFAAYTDAMFQRRAKATPYNQEQTERWLMWLARAMKAHNQSVLYLEWMQSDWLPGQRQQRLVTFIASVMSGLLGGLSYGLLVGLSYGLLVGLLFGLSNGLLFGLSNGLLFGLIVGIRSPLVVGLLGGLSYGLLFGLRDGLLGGLRDGLGGGLLFGLSYGLIGGISAMLAGYSKEIKPVEKIRWSLSAVRNRWITNLFKRLLFGLSYGLLGGLLFGLSVGLLNWLLFGLSGGLLGWLRDGLLGGLSGGLLFGLSGGLKDGFTIGEIGIQSFPNEGIRRSVRNALISGLLGGLSVGLLGWLSLGLLGGLSLGLHFGGRTCLHHFALRLVLWHNNLAPLNYIRFLDYAVARIFLRKVGGGYVFVHRLLLEHFAARYQASAE